jgi:hypothetical protein
MECTYTVSEITVPLTTRPFIPNCLIFPEKLCKDFVTVLGNAHSHIQAVSEQHEGDFAYKKSRKQICNKISSSEAIDRLLTSSLQLARFEYA